MSLLLKSVISSFELSYVLVELGLCQTWSETPKTGFLASNPIICDLTYQGSGNEQTKLHLFYNLKILSVDFNGKARKLITEVYKLLVLGFLFSCKRINNSNSLLLKHLIGEPGYKSNQY